VWYGNRWMNLSLEARCHGDGLIGYFRFFRGWLRCLLGKHNVISFCGPVLDKEDKLLGFEHYTACAYCYGEKKNGKDN
jgi:hypothetical protein